MVVNMAKKKKRKNSDDKAKGYSVELTGLKEGFVATKGYTVTYGYDTTTGYITSVNITLITTKNKKLKQLPPKALL